MQNNACVITSQYMHALSEETRLRCFRTLAASQTSLCVAELVDILQRPQYAISRGLAELRRAGLVQEERQGKLVFYTLSELPAVKALGEWVDRYCLCGTDASQWKNWDGSTRPGADVCAFDTERLHWRLQLRENNQVVHTYRSEQTEGDYRVRVLFICVHNSARSQLAEEYLRDYASDRFIVESAGLSPGLLNPWVVRLLAQEGIDISGKKPLAVAEKYLAGNTYQWVITVCSREAEENCPIFPGPVRRLSWPFPDPSNFKGSDAEIMGQLGDLAALIKQKVRAFADTN